MSSLSKPTRSAPPSDYFNSSHPVAKAAQQLCINRHKQRHELACGRCWEQAIRADERVVVAFDLPPEITPDPSYIDLIAVERAIQGESVKLTEAESQYVNDLVRVRHERRGVKTGYFAFPCVRFTATEAVAA